MRIRAGIVLIEDGKVALIERRRAGLHYYVFPGGGVDADETPEQAALRETKEEIGLDVVIKRKIAEVHIGESGRQYYFLAERVGGRFGSGTGEEFTNADPDNPNEGVYLPVWMPLEELPAHVNVYPADLAALMAGLPNDGWPDPLPVFVEDSK